MSDENKAVVRRCYAAMGTGDFRTMEELIADDLIEHEVFPGLEPNKPGVIQFFRMLREAFPDLTMTSNEIVSERDDSSCPGHDGGDTQGRVHGYAGNRQADQRFLRGLLAT